MEQAKELWNQTRDTARGLIGEQQRAAASGLEEFVDVLRRAARDSGGKSQVTKMVSSAADGLQHVSDALRTRDLDGLVRDVEGFARRQPAVFFGAAAVAGFLAMRFLKASEPAPTADTAVRESGSQALWNGER